MSCTATPSVVDANEPHPGVRQLHRRVEIAKGASEPERKSPSKSNKKRAAAKQNDGTWDYPARCDTSFTMTMSQAPVIQAQALNVPEDRTDFEKAYHELMNELIKASSGNSLFNFIAGLVLVWITVISAVVRLLFSYYRKYLTVHTEPETSLSRPMTREPRRPSKLSGLPELFLTAPAGPQSPRSIGTPVEVDTASVDSPVNFSAYIAFPSFVSCFLATVWSLFIAAFSQLPFTRRILLDRPSLFTSGIVGHPNQDGPSDDARSASGMTTYFIAEGHEASQTRGSSLLSPHVMRPGRPTSKIFMKMNMTDPGYSTTSMCAAQCALTLLYERSSCMSGGVCTPGIAFANTSLARRLCEPGQWQCFAVDVSDVPPATGPYSR